MLDYNNPYILNDIPEIKISYHPFYHVSEKRIIINSDQANRLFSTLRNRDIINLSEEILVAFLNHNYQVIGVRHHAKGTATSCSIDIKQIISVALKSNATWIIVAHNHPETWSYPSDDDIDITIQLDNASKICGLKLVDHIILSTEQDYYSFSDEWVIRWYHVLQKQINL